MRGTRSDSGNKAHRPVEPQRGVHRAGRRVGETCRVRGVRPDTVETDSERRGVPCRATDNPPHRHRLGRRFQRGQSVQGRCAGGVRPARQNPQEACQPGGRDLWRA